MVTGLPSFGHLTIARRASGEPVTIVRSPDEQVFLAFDTQIKRLVELHVLRRGQSLDGAAKRSACERAQMAAEVRGPSFMRVLEVGEDEGLVYYTSNLNEGEFVTDYIARRGALPPATVFTLLLHLLDDLLLLGDRQRLVSQMRLDRVMVTTVEDTFLQLRLYDFGLSSDEASEKVVSSQVVQVCELMFLLLTGKVYSGENPDRYPSLTALPMSLRTAVRTALIDPYNAPTSTEKLRDDVREACGAFISGIQARNSRKQLVVTPALQPHSQLQDLLLEGVPVEKVLGNRFSVEDAGDVRRYPFSIPCLNVKNELLVTVHLLPPSRIVEKSQYDAVPLQSWRFNADKHPNILRSLSLWESPDWSFLTEEREPGFTLSRLLTERLTLNPTEVAVLLRQVRAGLEQAQECGVERIELHPSNIMLRVGKAGPMMNREHDRLMQKRLDAWPPFLVKLRGHLTMRNLYEAPLVDLPDPNAFDGEHQIEREYRHRTFVALAAYLLTGARQVAETPAFPEAVPEALAVFIRETLEQTRHSGRTPAPSEFLEKFESIMNGPAAPDLATKLRGANVALEEMESVGSVSDFDDDQEIPLDDFDVETSPISRRLRAHEFDHRTSKRSSAWPVWAAAAVVILGFLAWWFMPGKASVEAPVAAEEIKSEAKKEVPAKPVEVAAVPTTSKPEPAKVEAPKPPQPEAKTVVSAPPAVTPVPSVATTAPAPKPPVPAQATPTPLPLTPPPPVKVPNPVIIRKALLPSAEEIAKFKQGQVKPMAVPLPAQTTPAAPQDQRVGSMPTINVAQPLSPDQAQDRR